MSAFCYPLEWNWISQGYKPTHRALDFGWSSAHGGSCVPVRSVGAGRVVYVADGHDNARGSNSRGNQVLVEMDGGYCARYIHLHKNSIAVKIGDRVEMWQELGKMGNSGDSAGAHLHLEITKAGERIDPVGVLYIHTDKQKAQAQTAASFGVKTYSPDPKDMRIQELTLENSLLRDAARRALEVLEAVK